jgi:serine/threonine protein kinase
MGNYMGCRRKSKSVVVLSEVNRDIIKKMYEIINPKQNPEVIQRNSKGALPRGFKDPERVPEEQFSQLLVDIFNCKGEPFSIMIHFPHRYFHTTREIDLSITSDKDDIIFKIPEIGGGSYGLIYLSKYFPNPNYPELCVGKKTQYPPDATEVEKYDINNSFIEEMLTSILLYEITEKKPKIPQVFPKIIGSYQTNEGLVMQMEKLDMTLYQFFRPARLIERIKILIIIAHSINLLQKNYDFVHGDLHPGNIMLKEESLTIEINGKTIQSNYRPYFIDLGMVCVDLSTCCGLTDMRVKGGAYRDPNYCKNRSQDLRLLLYSLWDDSYVGPLEDFIEKLFKYKIFYRDGLEITYKSLFLTYYNQPSHALYQAVADIDDKDFYPENIVDELLKLLDRLTR